MRYAVGQKPVREILQNFIECETEAFGFADYGIRLSDDDQKRRFLIQSLLQMEGLLFADYETRFQSSARVDFGSELSEFVDLGLLEIIEGRMRLTSSGLEWSDRIGYEMYSPNILKLMSQHEAL
jgi:oxygen-independent coproporphyrinogen-3 oxidase